MTDLKKVLRFAMKMEKQGENFYLYYKNQVSDPANKQLFEELAEIENQHYRLLQEKYDSLEQKPDLKDISWVVDTNNYVRHPSIFSNHASQRIDLDMDSQVEDLAIMRMAYSIENDFSEFYHMVAQKIDVPEIKEFIIKLAEWEEGHRKIFYEQYKKLLQRNWQEIETIIFPREK